MTKNVTSPLARTSAPGRGSSPATRAQVLAENFCSKQILLEYQELSSGPTLHPLLLFDIVTSTVDLSDPSDLFWWQRVTRGIAYMLHKAAYTIDDQAFYLLYYYVYVLPSHGPMPTASGKPANWRSWTCDDHTPIESSFEWGRVGNPKVRFSIEAIAHDRGQDPFNVETTLALLARLQHDYPQTVDLTWCLAMVERLCLALPHHRQQLEVFMKTHERSTDSDATQLFTAWDFSGNRTWTLKSYVVPEVRARVEGRPSIALITELMSDLGLQEPWSYILRYCEELERERPGFIRPVIVATDCVKPDESRIKVYMRHSDMTLQTARQALTLNGRLRGGEIDDGVASVEELWSMLYANDPSPKPTRAFSTDGFLCYYELRRGRQQPTSKAYLSGRNYVDDDARISQLIESFLTANRLCQGSVSYRRDIACILYVMGAKE